MKYLLVLFLVFIFWFNFVFLVLVDDFVNLIFCSENFVYLVKFKNFFNIINDFNFGKIWVECYVFVFCGFEGYFYLIVDGCFIYVGDFLIFSILFLYIVGWIGWVGCFYLIEIWESKNFEM